MKNRLASCDLNQLVDQTNHQKNKNRTRAVNIKGMVLAKSVDRSKVRCELNI